MPSIAVEAYSVEEHGPKQFLANSVFGGRGISAPQNSLTREGYCRHTLCGIWGQIFWSANHKASPVFGGNPSVPVFIALLSVWFLTDLNDHGEQC